MQNLKPEETKDNKKTVDQTMTKDEILWRETQAENREINQAKTDDYYLTMFPELF